MKMVILSTATVLSNKFQSVFTQENTTDIPNCNSTPYPIMPDIAVSCDGVQNFFETLDPSKESGPDNIPMRILCKRDCSNSNCYLYPVPNI